MLGSIPWINVRGMAISLFTSQISLADNKQSIIPASDAGSFWHAIISLGGGLAFPQDIGASQTFPIVNPVTDSFYIYNANHSNKTVGLFDSFFGVEWLVDPKWALQLGLGYIRSSNFSIKGSLLQGADIQSSDQYSYNYTIATNQLVAESKLRYQFNKRFYPYVLLGLGEAFNTAHDYNTNVPPFLTFTREYKDNTQSSFTYLVGIGFDVDIANYLRLGLGYRFSNLGTVKLGKAMIDTSSVASTLSQDHIQVNEIIAQLTFVI